ncbi:MAG: hypothetical protein JST04_06570 [Bdellovibrionales bacterium]|nr:hypothetical protein [Bdellovibrionales bacterium]
MEKFIYELRPFFFFVAGVAALIARTHPLMIISGLLLITASSVILHRRYKHRLWLAT